MIEKTKPTWRMLGLGVLLSGLASIACADGADLFGDDFAAELRASKSPRDWALAADISGGDGGFPADRVALLAKAAAAAPDDTFVQWLALANLKNGDVPEADMADRARRLVASDPDNAATSMPSLTLAVKANDAARVDEALARMAAAKRFDTHMTTYLFAWLDIYARRIGPGDQSYGRMQSIARAAAFTLPSYRQLVLACDPGKSEAVAPTRLDRCAAVARTMTTASDIVTPMIGYTILRKTGRATPQETEAERTLRWLQKNQTLPESDLEVLPELARTVADWRETGSEQEVYRRRVQRAGIAPTPPPGWDWDKPKQ